MHHRPKTRNRGFTLLEFVITMTVMLIVMGATISLMRDSVKVAVTTYEVTDAQQALRIAQEFINRDLMNAGDGLESISNIRLPLAFVTNYITLSPVTNPATPGIINLGIFTSDNNIPAGTAVRGAVPATNIRTATDRQTILQIDPTFVAISPTAIDSTGGVVTLPATAIMTNFIAGEVYFLTSTLGATFSTLTGVNSGTRQLFFASGAADPFGLNLTGTGGHIKTISSSGTLPTSLQRMRLIQYYVTTSGLLTRRVFGVASAGFRESIIAEHVVDVQFNYSLVTTDASGNVTPSSSTTLTTSTQQLAVRQVEVKVTVETPHAIQTGSRQPMTMTTSTSVRNMQFRQAL
jgi:prepilin-type N-terminal cleavage/methylation domain-containing protein